MNNLSSLPSLIQYKEKLSELNELTLMFESKNFKKFLNIVTNQSNRLMEELLRIPAEQVNKVMEHQSLIKSLKHGIPKIINSISAEAQLVKADIEHLESTQTSAVKDESSGNS